MQRTDLNNTRAKTPRLTASQRGAARGQNLKVLKIDGRCESRAALTSSAELGPVSSPRPLSSGVRLPPPPRQQIGSLARRTCDGDGRGARGERWWAVASIRLLFIYFFKSLSTLVPRESIFITLILPKISFNYF